MTRFVILTNELPALADGSGALAGRLVALLLTESFFGKEDHELTSKLTLELPGILNWAIEGYRRLRQRGHFIVPNSAQEAIDDIETLGAPVKAFIRERCFIEPRAWIICDDLFNAWKGWCEDEGRDGAGTKQWFGRNLRTAEAKLTVEKKKVGGGPQAWNKERFARVYVGIDLLRRNAETHSAENPLAHIDYLS
jgi:putative DNA primase/helicase